jgi:hypothetical protein
MKPNRILGAFMCLITVDTARAGAVQTDVESVLSAVEVSSVVSLSSVPVFPNQLSDIKLYRTDPYAADARMVRVENGTEY